MSNMELLQEELIKTSAWMLCSTELQRKMYTDILHDCTIQFVDCKGNIIESAELTELYAYLVGIENFVWHAKSLKYVAGTIANIIRDIDRCGYYCLANYTEDIYDNGFADIHDDIDPREVSVVETIAIYVLVRD